MIPWSIRDQFCGKNREEINWASVMGMGRNKGFSKNEIDFLASEVDFLASEVDFLDSEVDFLVCEVDFLASEVDFQKILARKFT